jgi:hypothetical protein
MAVACRRLLVALLALGLIGIAGERPTRAGSGGQSPATSAELIERFRAAHEQRDADAALALAYWPGTEPGDDELLRWAISSDFDQTLAAITIEPIQLTDVLEYTRDGVTYRPGIPVVGWLTLRFAPTPGPVVATSFSTYLVGQHDGAYYVTIGAPVVAD